MAMKTEEKKIIYSCSIKQIRILPPCLSSLPEGWQMGDVSSGKSVVGPGAWDLDEVKCKCGKHILRSRKTYDQDLFSRQGYIIDVYVEVEEI